MKNKTTTKKGTGRVHKNGYVKPVNAGIKKIPFSAAITEWITQMNLKKLANKKVAK